MRVTRRESKREEKRTGSGSIRRASERDGVIEGDRGNGEAAALLRLEGKGMGTGEAEGSTGYVSAREARELAARERRRETKPSRIPRAQHWQPNERTYVRMETYENIEISVFLARRNERSGW